MQAEKAVLGTMLKQPYLISDAALHPDQLEQQHHKEILRAMQELQAKGKGVDLVTMISYYDARLFGGANYLTELTTLARESKFDDYLNAVQDAYRHREKRNILSHALADDWEIDNVMSELDKLQEGDLNDHADIFKLTSEVYEAPYQEVKLKKGVTTGLMTLNQMTNGLQDAELTILAARPSMGKSDVMLHFAKQAGWSGYLPIIFSLEMSAVSLRDRLIASTGGFNRAKMRNPKKALTDAQKSEWMPTLHRLSDTKIQIFDRSGQTVPEMRAKVRKLMHQYPDKKPVIFIDYLTLIRSASPSGNEHKDVGDITKALKAMAKEFDCPVVSLAQLSRKVEQRPDKRPMLSDLRESGSIEEDADVAMFLYRDSYYTKKSDEEQEDRSFEIIVAKNRNGATGTVYAEYNRHTGRITEP